MSITLRFPDGSKKGFSTGVTGFEVATSISEGLARNTIAMRLNDEVVDIMQPIIQDAAVTFLTWNDDAGKEVFRHSAAHLFAQALLRKYPQAQLAAGPPTDTGFFYDIMLDVQLTPEKLVEIEEEMKKIVNEKLEITKDELSRVDAEALFKDNKFKLHFISQAEGDSIQIYKQGEFVDFCRGPHIRNTGMLKAFKLTKVSGAYWLGDAKNEQLQRVYGIAFPDKKEMKAYLEKLALAEQRDHRNIVKKLNLVMFHEYAPGAPFFLTRGTIMYNELVQFIRGEYRKRGYEEVITPQLYNKKLWEQSGHWEHYRENMFIITIEGEEHSLKPMNCPSHCLIYNRDTKSYKDLPVRIADFCNLHRNELSGTLSGMTRVRKFSQDDAHIFCRMDQVEDEVLDVLEFIKYVWEDVFDFKLTYFLSTRPDEKLGDDALWDTAEDMLKKALARAGISYTIKEGDGAFYGPKIDIDLEDALGRKWQCPTCQLDFNLPQRFGCMYETADAKKEYAVMIHRAVLGSLERFMAMMIEHYGGRFPLWLNPEQIRLLPIADRHMDFCKQIKEQMEVAGLRVNIDAKPATTSKKVRNAQLDQVHYILVIGDKEVEHGTVNVRTREEQQLGEQQIDAFIQKLVEDVRMKR